MEQHELIPAFKLKLKDEKGKSKIIYLKTLNHFKELATSMEPELSSQPLVDSICEQQLVETSSFTSTHDTQKTAVLLDITPMAPLSFPTDTSSSNISSEHSQPTSTMHNSIPDLSDAVNASLIQDTAPTTSTPMLTQMKKSLQLLQHRFKNLEEIKENKLKKVKKQQ